MVRNLAPHLRPGDRVASYRAFVPTAIPYIKRPLYFFHFDNSSGLREADVEASPFLLGAAKQLRFRRVAGAAGPRFHRNRRFPKSPGSDRTLFVGPHQRSVFAFQSSAPRRFERRTRFRRARPSPRKTSWSNLPNGRPAPTETMRAAPWKWALRVAIGVAIVALLLSRRDAATQVAQTLRAVPLWVIAGAVALYWAGQILSAWKWQLLLRARGADVSLGACCQLYAAGHVRQFVVAQQRRRRRFARDAARRARARTGQIGRTRLHPRRTIDRFFRPARHRRVRLAPARRLGATRERALTRTRLTRTRLTRTRLTRTRLTRTRLTRTRLARTRLTRVRLTRGAPDAGRAGLANAVTFRWRFFAALGLLIWVVGRVKHPKIERLRAALAFYARPQHRGVMMQALALSLLFQASQVLLNIGLASASGLGVTGARVLVAGAAIIAVGPDSGGHRRTGRARSRRRRAAPGLAPRRWPNRRMVVVVASDGVAGRACRALCGCGERSKDLWTQEVYLPMLKKCLSGSTCKLSPSARTGAARGT